MASYEEIYGLLSIDDTSGLREKVSIATLVKADTIRLEIDDGTEPVRARKRFSQQVLRQNLSLTLVLRGDSSALANASYFEAVYRQVLIANRANTVNQITGATDAQIQTAVDEAVDHLAATYQDPVTP